MLDFAIVGWPKTGTSSLYHWLNDHPEVEGSDPKELFYLMDQDHPLINGKNNWHVNKEKGLQSYFSKNKDTLKFEATTHYFYQDTALKYFKEINQEAIVIFILREPARRILSSFNYTKENLASIKKKFTFNEYADALLNDNTESLDEQYLSDGSLYIAKKELELSDYNSWLQKWEEAIGKNRLLVLKFDELKKNPIQLLERIGAVIGFDASFYANYAFSKKNMSRSISHYRIHRFMRKLKHMLPSSLEPIFLKSLYFKVQRSESDNSADSYSTGLKLLQNYFSKENE